MPSNNWLRQLKFPGALQLARLGSAQGVAFPFDRGAGRLAAWVNTMAVDRIEPGAQTGVVLAVLWSAVTILTQQFYLWVCFVNKVPWDGECTRNLDPWLKQGHASCNFPRFGFPTPLSCPVNTAGHRCKKDRTGTQPRGLSHHSVVDLRVALCPREHNSKWQTFKRWKDHGRKENAFLSLLLEQGALPFHFALSSANSVYALAVELPAWDCCALPRPACPVSAAVDCHHDRSWANFAPKSFPPLAGERCDSIQPAQEWQRAENYKNSGMAGRFVLQNRNSIRIEAREVLLSWDPSGCRLPCLLISSPVWNKSESPDVVFWKK